MKKLILKKKVSKRQQRHEKLPSIQELIRACGICLNTNGFIETLNEGIQTSQGHHTYPKVCGEAWLSHIIPIAEDIFSVAFKRWLEISCDCLLADKSHAISSLVYLKTNTKNTQNVLSAAVLIRALRVKVKSFEGKCYPKM